MGPLAPQRPALESPKLALTKEKIKLEPRFGKGISAARVNSQSPAIH